MERVIEFLKKYILFFQEMEQKQEEKLEALATGKIDRIEEMIVMQQALGKQLENMEQARLALFRENGLEAKAFTELIDTAAGTDKRELQELHGQLEKSIGNVRFLNEKCMKLAETALASYGITADRTRGGAGQKYEQARESSGRILERKI